MRKPWTESEIKDVGLGFEAFHQLHPDRSYNSWEVKRRRLEGGSAGTGRAPIQHRNSVACACVPLLIHRSALNETFVIAEQDGF